MLVEELEVTINIQCQNYYKFTKANISRKIIVFAHKNKDLKKLAMCTTLFN